MEVVYDLKNWVFEGRGIVTIGTFDGVHRGHQKILRRLNELKKKKGGKSIVFTFHPHPRKVLFPNQNDLRLLTDLNEKLDLLKSADIDICVVFPFTAAFSQIEPDEFISDILVKKLKVSTLVIGYDHKFGKARSGNIDTFKNAAPVYNFEVEEIAAEDVNQINVSSTRIRKALFEGDVKLAAGFLGHAYFLSGVVVQGKQLGRTIGYPTANIKVSDADKLVPKIGVYCVKVQVDGFNGYGMMSIGYNPTTDTDQTIKVEVNIFNFDKDIYTKNIRVEFIDRIRDEKKFDSLGELTAAIQQDEIACKNIIK